MRVGAEICHTARRRPEAAGSRGHDWRDRRLVLEPPGRCSQSPPRSPCLGARRSYDSASKATTLGDEPRQLRERLADLGDLAHFVVVVPGARTCKAKLDGDRCEFLINE